MKGRKPKPTAIKLLDGSRLTELDKNQPPTKAGSIDPPEWIKANKFSLEHWKEVAPIVSEMGLLTEGSRLALAQLCDDFAEMRSVICSGKAKIRYNKMLAEFGLTPASLCRIKAQGPPKKDALALFLEENKS